MLHNRFAARIGDLPRLSRLGRVTRVVGLVIEAVGLDVGLSELCRVTSLSEEKSVLAEVVGFHERGVLLMPLGDIDGLHPGSGVTPLGRSFGADVGPGLLGRVLNGLGHPIDGKGNIEYATRMPLSAYTFRAGRDVWFPLSTLPGPRVLIANEFNGSGAESFAALAFGF